MRRSAFYLPTLREPPREATIISHQLMLRSGMIYRIASGIYSLLPLAVRVLRKMEAIVREEHEKIACYEMVAPTVQPASLWKESERYQDYGQEMLRFSDRKGAELLYGPTAEEILTKVVTQGVKSFRDLPKKMFNIQWKFRDEERPRFGVMRGREFLMKDAYSFDASSEGAVRSYFEFFNAYMTIFQRMGLKVIPLKAQTGPIGGDLSHEFHVVAENGESALYYQKEFDELSFPYSREEVARLYAAADDRHNPEDCPVPLESLKVARGIEVGHIFYFGKKYSEKMGASFVEPQGKKQGIEMGSYGIGLSRLLGAVIEAYHDDKGILWPQPIAPFTVALMDASGALGEAAEAIYHELENAGFDVLYDDRPHISPGEKFKDMDLIGIPHQVVLGKDFKQSNQLEWSRRQGGETQHITLESLVHCLKQS